MLKITAKPFLMERKTLFSSLPVEEFYDISDIIYQALQKHDFISKPTLDEILQTDEWSRQYVRDYLKKI